MTMTFFFPQKKRMGLWRLEQVEDLKVLSEDGVLDGSEHEADVLRVSGAGEVRVDLLILIRVLFLVHLEDKLLSCRRVVTRP